MSEDYLAILRSILDRNDISDQGKELLRRAMARQAEAEAKRKLSLEIVSAGYRALSVKFHPDKGGSLADMTRLTDARDNLRRSLAPPPSLKKRKPKSKLARSKAGRRR